MALTGGLLGIIIGALTILLGCLGFWGALARERTPLLIFEVCCGIFLVFIIVSLILIFVLDSCLVAPFDPISSDSSGRCGGIGNIVVQCLIGFFYVS